MQFRRWIAACVCVVVTCHAAHAEDDAHAPVFGGPDSVEIRISEDVQSWDDIRQGLIDNYGLVISGDYSTVWMTADDTVSDDTAAGGIARVYGTYDLGKFENGALVYKFEHRHGFGSTSPFDFSLGQIGYAGLLSPPFSDGNFRTQNLYWRQRLNDGRATLVAGILDVTDYVDVFGLGSPWMHFSNLAFSTGSATIGLPNDASVGVALGAMLGDHVYMVAGIADTNGDPSRPFEGFENFFSDNEYFTSVEFGITLSQQRIFFDNYHITFWHKDEQEAAAISDGWGVAVSASRFVNEKWAPFVRGGYAKDAGSLLEASASVGLGYKTDVFDGLFGAAINWGRPNESTFLPDLDDQLALEVFYRFGASEHLALTVDVQYIKDPALNAEEDSVFVTNLRARFSF